MRGESCSLNDGRAFFNWLLLLGVWHPAKDQVVLIGGDEGNLCL